MIFLWILLSFIIFSIIVLVHEYGHYKSARIFWVHIEEFWLWIPPRAKKLWKNKTGTLFSLNWIPLGWFVKIAGESELFLEYFDENWHKLSEKNLEKKLKNVENIYNKTWNKISISEKKYVTEKIKSFKKGQNFYEKNILQKTIILAAGVIMNFLLAGIIFSLLFVVWVKPIWVNSFIPTSTSSKIIPTLEQAKQLWIIQKKDWVILFPTENSPAENSGILQGDILLSVNGEEIWDISSLQKFIWENAEKTLIFKVNTLCNDTKNCPISWERTIEIIPNSAWKIGSYLSENLEYNQDFVYKYQIIDAIKYGFLESYFQARLTLSGLWYLLGNIISPETPQDRQDAINSVAGPIWIVDVITKSISYGVWFILVLSAIISVNLWVFNLLPIPALDGGRIVLLWIRSSIEKIAWKKSLAIKIENFIHVYTFLLLIALSVIIAYNDIVKIIFR